MAQEYESKQSNARPWWLQSMKVVAMIRPSACRRAICTAVLAMGLGVACGQQHSLQSSPHETASLPLAAGQLRADRLVEPVDRDSFVSGYRSLFDHAGAMPRFPALWVFTPEGRLFEQVTDEQRVRTLLANFEALHKSDVDEVIHLGQIAYLLEELRVRSGHRLLLADDRWTLLVLADEESCGQDCAGFGHAADELIAAHPERLRAVHLVMTR